MKLHYKCPSCDVNYERRLFRKSPVRAFRTGFAKVSQIFTKELFYELPEKEIISRKLVVFSDSREDAAQIANGVERNHYTDLVREIVCDELRLSTLGEPQLLDYIENGSEEPGPEAIRYLDRYQDAEEKLRKSLETANASVEDMPESFQKLAQQEADILEEIRMRGITRVISE